MPIDRLTRSRRRGAEGYRSRRRWPHYLLAQALLTALKVNHRSTSGLAPVNSATAIRPTASKGETEAGLLRCPECSQPLAYQSAQALICSHCTKSFEVRGGIVYLHEQYQGNNAIAAEYYNSRLWPKFRFWESVAYLPRGGERRARREVLRHLPDLSGTRLLDVAIGDGQNLPLLPKDCQVFGVDVSSVLLTKCKQDYADRDLHLIVGPAEALPFHACCLHRETACVQSLDRALAHGHWCHTVLHAMTW